MYTHLYTDKATLWVIGSLGGVGGGQVPTAEKHTETHTTTTATTTTSTTTDYYLLLLALLLL